MDVPGIKDVGYYRIQGQTNLELPIDRQKCALWNISVADVHDVIQTAIGGKTVSQMIEGEKSFDITIRWPERLRADETDILDIPVDVTGHRGQPARAQPGGDADGARPRPAAATRCHRSPAARAAPLPLETLTTPRERLGDLVTPLSADSDFALDPKGSFVRSGASMISASRANA